SRPRGASVKKPLGLAEYIAALQCERRLWLATRAAEEVAPEPGGAPRPVATAREATAREATALDAWLAERGDLEEILDALLPHARRLPGGLALSGGVGRPRGLVAGPPGQGLRGAVLERGGWVAAAPLLGRRRGGQLVLCLPVADTALRELDLD